MVESLKNQSFTTQEQIIKDLHLDSEGFCSPLANLFAETRLKGTSPDFLKGTSQQIYDVANKLDQIQFRLFKNGKDGPDYAFRDRIYSITKLTFKDHKPTEKEFSKLMDRHNLVTYSLASDQSAYHQVYLGKDTEGEQKNCTLFNASYPGGVKTGPCDTLVKELYEAASKYLRQNDKKSYIKIASTDGTPLNDGEYNEPFEFPKKFMSNINVKSEPDFFQTFMSIF